MPPWPNFPPWPCLDSQLPSNIELSLLCHNDESGRMLRLRTTCLFPQLSPCVRSFKRIVACVSSIFGRNPTAAKSIAQETLNHGQISRSSSLPRKDFGGLIVEIPWSSSFKVKWNCTRWISVLGRLRGKNIIFLTHGSLPTKVTDTSNISRHDFHLSGILRIHLGTSIYPLVN